MALMMNRVISVLAGGRERKPTRSKSRSPSQFGVVVPPQALQLSSSSVVVPGRASIDLRLARPLTHRLRAASTK